MGIRDYSTTPADNATAGSVNFAENQAPSTLNDSGRQVLADIREWYEDAQWVDLGHTPTYVSATSFTIATDVTATYEANRRIKMYGSTMGTFYGTISSSSYGAPNTTVNVTMDSGALTNNLSRVYVGALTVTNPAVPGNVLTTSSSISRSQLPVTQDHGTKATNYSLDISTADTHLVAFSAAATLTISSSNTNDKAIVVVKNGGFAITLAGIDNDSPTLTNAASKQDFLALVKSFGKISCVSNVLNKDTV